jgi:hypothetical protein
MLHTAKLHGAALVLAAMVGCGLPDTNPCLTGVETHIDLVSSEAGGVRLSGERACVSFTEPNGPLQVEMTREGRNVFYVRVEPGSGAAAENGPWPEGVSNCADDQVQAFATVDTGPEFRSSWHGGSCALTVTQLPASGTFAGDFQGTLARASTSGSGDELLEVRFNFSIPTND